MSIVQIEEAIKRQYPDVAERAIASLVRLADEHSIVPKLYAGTWNPMSQPRTVLDVTMVSGTNVKGVASFDFEIKPGVTLLYGVNDAGKSARLTALRLALFGTRDAERYVKRGESKLYAGVTMGEDVVKRSYTVKSITRGKNAGETKVEHKLYAKLEGAEDDKPGQAQDLIQSWLGVPEDFIARTAFITQGDMAALIHEQPGARRDLVYQMLGLHAAEETRAKFAAISRDLAAKASEAQSQATGYQKSLDELARLMKGCDPDVLKAEIASLSEKRDATPAAPTSDVARTKMAQLQSHVQQQQQNRSERQRLKELIEKIELQGQPIPYPMPDGAEEAQTRRHNATVQLVQARQQLTGVKQQGLDLKALPLVCPTCKLLGKTCELTAEMKAARRDELLKEYRELELKVKNLEAVEASAVKSIAAIADQVTLSQTRAAEIADYQARLAQHRASLQAYEAAIMPDETVSAWQKEVEQLRASVDRGACPRKALEQEIDIRKQALAAHAANEQRVVEVAAAKLSAEKRAKELVCESDEAQRLASLFSKDELPLKIAQEHLLSINKIANDLSALDRYCYGFNDDLSVHIVDRDGPTEISPAAASGSSLQRCALVLTAALSKYLQELAGVKIPLLWIDEVPFQDEANASVRLVAILRSMLAIFPKIVFAASNWDLYLGQFDHEVSVGDAAPIADPFEKRSEPTKEQVEAHIADHKAREDVPPLVEMANAAPDVIAGGINFSELQRETRRVVDAALEAGKVTTVSCAACFTGEGPHSVECPDRPQVGVNLVPAEAGDPF